MIFDPMYFVIVGPALILAIWAQAMVRSAYVRAQQVPARMSGAVAARAILDAAGLHHVAIEPIPGVMTDHFDPRSNVLRLSAAVYQGRHQAAVGIAAHEAGHALQKATHYPMLAIRNAAVPVAGIGSSCYFGLIVLGGLIGSLMLIQLGILLFAGIVIFQIINLPVEFDASARAKRQLVALGIVAPQELGPVRAVLRAAALTYVAATLQSLLVLLYYVFRFTDRRD